MRILAFQITHDSSVCSIHNGNIEFFCKEERLTRKKRDGHSFKALELYFEQNYGKVDKALYLTPSNYEPQNVFLYKTYFEKKFGVELENYSSLNHHECHASLAFYNSGFSECLVIVVDRNGSVVFANENERVAREAESVFVCSYPNNIKPVYKAFWSFPGHDNRNIDLSAYIEKLFPNCDTQLNNSYSIVKVYEASTTLIGQNALENGKTMGLSSYGENKEYHPLFIDGKPISNYFSHMFFEPNGNLDTVCWNQKDCQIIKEVTPDNYQFYADKAKHVQLETQKEVLSLIKKYVEKTGIKNVCIVGGYGLNVVANAHYVKNLPDVKFYFEPIADDTGVPIGAAMLEYRKASNDKSIKTPKNNFFHYYKKEEKNYGKKTNIDEICDLLIKGKSVAIFEGSPEAGPRALGHRSILFDPRNKNSKDLINKVKKREWYRPFAGVVLQEDLSKYFNTMGLNSSEYMTINFDCKENIENEIPGVIHVDNTCRVQTVNSGTLFNILTKFKEKTNCSVLLNTSFNLAGEPLVQTKEDAIRALNNSLLDAIFFVDDGTLYERKKP